MIWKIGKISRSLSKLFSLSDPSRQNHIMTSRCACCAEQQRICFAAPAPLFRQGLIWSFRFFARTLCAGSPCWFLAPTLFSSLSGKEGRGTSPRLVSCSLPYFQKPASKVNSLRAFPAVVLHSKGESMILMFAFGASPLGPSISLLVPTPQRSIPASRRSFRHLASPRLASLPFSGAD